MASWQTFDLGERGIDGLGVERPPAFEERLLVTEITDMRAPTRHDDGVRDQIEMAFDQVTPDGWDAGERSDLRLIKATRPAGFEIHKEVRPRILARAEKNRVGVLRGF